MKACERICWAPECAAISIDPGMVETEFSDVRFHGDKERAAKVYRGVTPLTAEDVADAIVWAVSRPAHVNIERMIMTSIDQANSFMFNRKTRGLDALLKRHQYAC